jgi:hypothetical protein
MKFAQNKVEEFLLCLARRDFAEAESVYKMMNEDNLKQLDNVLADCSSLVAGFSFKSLENFAKDE